MPWWGWVLFGAAAGWLLLFFLLLALDKWLDWDLPDL